FCADFASSSVLLLVHARRRLPYRPAADLKQQLSAAGDLCCAHPVEGEANSTGVRPWRDDEVVLQLLLVAVINEVDSGVEPGVFDLREGRDTGAPSRWIRTSKVTGSSGQLGQAGNLRRAAADPAQADNVAAYARSFLRRRDLLAPERHQQSILGEKNGGGGLASKKPRARFQLSIALLAPKGERAPTFSPR